MKIAGYAMALAATWSVGVTANAALTEQGVLVLINGDSETSAYVAAMYREYHPGITNDQVLKLRDLPDCASPTATPADEIITRDQYETLIADKVRAHLIATGLVNDIFCIMTTAGIPYRIEDTNEMGQDLSDVITPAGSDANLVLGQQGLVTAASVESELAVLWQTDPAQLEFPDGPRPYRRNRMVNPYQGYVSTITDWVVMRNMLGRRDMFRWTVPILCANGPTMEGIEDDNGVSAEDRLFCPADIYLTCRLDGPRNTGERPIYAIRKLLERAARASDPSHVRFTGYDSTTAVIAFDQAPGVGNIVSNAIVNVPKHWDFVLEQACPFEFNDCVPLWTLNFADFALPPTAINCNNTGDDYERSFTRISSTSPPDVVLPPAGQLTLRTGSWGLGYTAYFDDTSLQMDRSRIASGESLLALATFGTNGDDGRNRQYLLTGGPLSEPLFRMAPGAVFTSAESFNAVTMFQNPNTFQGKIVDFIDVGGAGAVGHVFEPIADALFDTEFFFRNFIRDDDGDNVADLSFVEAAFTAMPYVSWAEIVIGDPLMRLRSGPGGRVNIQVVNGRRFEELGDFDGDGIVGANDALEVLWLWSQISVFPDDLYDDRADFDADGDVDGDDLDIVLQYYGTNYNLVSPRSRGRYKAELQDGGPGSL